MDIDQMEAGREKELERWKRVAIYLASCHAATAEYDGQLKSVSLSRKDRYAEICHKAIRYLRNEANPPRHGQSAEEELDQTIKRCENACMLIWNGKMEPLEE